MKRTTKYVAFDVHQATTVASIRDEQLLHGPDVVPVLQQVRGERVPQTMARYTLADSRPHRAAYLPRTAAADSDGHP